MVYTEMCLDHRETSNAHCETIAARLSSSTLSSFYNTSMVSTYYHCESEAKIPFERELWVLQTCLAISFLFYGFAQSVLVYTACIAGVVLLSSTPHRYPFLRSKLRQTDCIVLSQHDMATAINKLVAAEQSQGLKWVNVFARFLLFNFFIFQSSILIYTVTYLLLPWWKILGLMTNYKDIVQGCIQYNDCYEDFCWVTNRNGKIPKLAVDVMWMNAALKLVSKTHI